MKVLVANRGEIAVRLIRAATELGLETVAVSSTFESPGLHVALATEHSVLRGSGAAAYLDVEQLVQVALSHKCSAVVPGYGFLSESPIMARACEEAGLIFVGAVPQALDLFGDKVESRKLAEKVFVPTIPGRRVESLESLEEFFDQYIPSVADAVILKATHGGGGRGMRVVRERAGLKDALSRCSSEALKAFGSAQVFVELFVRNVKHIEVQIVADTNGNLACIGERECSVQRQHQKLIELAPCASLSELLRQKLFNASMELARAAGLVGLGTFEFLVSCASENFFFIECNPRLQVEHTVTEQLWGVDLVQSQLRIALFGDSLESLALPKTPRLGGYAIQFRINSEQIQANGTAQPSFGTVRAINLPSGPGIRVDTCATVGFAPNGNFDSLIAKLIVWAPTFEDVLRRSHRALSEVFIDGLETNVYFHRAAIEHEHFVENAKLDTGFLTSHIEVLLSRTRTLQQDAHRLAYLKDAAQPMDQGSGSLENVGEDQIGSPLSGQVVDVLVSQGTRVEPGTKLVVLSAFKMEHELESERYGVIARVLIQKGDTCMEGQVLFELEKETDSKDTLSKGEAESESIDLDTYNRADLDKLFERRAYLEDSFRKEKIETKRHAIGRRSARENVMDLVDPLSWIEYGDLALAHQLGKHTLEHLLSHTQRDGIIGGIGRVNGDLFPKTKRTSCVVMSYDYLVYAGTQGVRGHKKKDRMFEIAGRWNLPVVLFTEGGGGRPNDFTPKDAGSTGLGEPAWFLLGRASNSVRIGIASGYNFAGNAALLGMCDIIIATEDASIAMAGPVMVEFAGQGKVDPTLLGPAKMQFQNGVVHLLVRNELEATSVAKQCLSYFQGSIDQFQARDQRVLRTLLPVDRKKSYDVKKVIRAMADSGSVLEICSAFGRTTVVAFARVEGRPLGIVANQPLVLGGALDADGCEKASLFLSLCNRFRIPVLTLCDTPGFIVGVEFEKTRLVKYTSKLFQVASSLSVPHFTIVLRKAYGLGAMAMSGGAFQRGTFIVGWPTAEFGGMGLEGAVQLGFRKELDAIQDPVERQRMFDALVQAAYDRGSSLQLATEFSIDTVIDPCESRHWINSALDATTTSKL